MSGIIPIVLAAVLVVPLPTIAESALRGTVVAVADGDTVTVLDEKKR